MRGKEVAKPFFHDCVKKMKNGTKAYKGFKVWELKLLSGFKFLLMVILIPRKKNGFDPGFEEVFKAYNNWGGCPFKGYDSKINLISTVRKNKNLFKVLLNKHGIFIFREKMDVETESTMNDEISADREATVFSGEIPTPTSKFFKYDSDVIEEVSEKIVEGFILPKILEEIPVSSVDRVTIGSDFNSDSSGYESALTSPSFENSLFSMDSPVDSEGFCENDDNQVQENNLLELEDIMNSSSFQNLPSTSSMRQLSKTSQTQFFKEQAITNVFMSELGDKGNSCSFQNLPSTFSVGQLVQTSPVQLFTKQALTNTSIQELRDTTNFSSFQNLPSASFSGQLIQTSPEQIFTEQTLTDTSIPELKDTRNSSSFQNLPSASSSGQLIQTSPGQFFTKQTLTDASIPELGGTMNSLSCQNLPSSSSVGQFVQTSPGQFFIAQILTDASIPELKGTMNSFSCQNLPSSSSVGQFVQTSPGQFFTAQTLTDASIPELGDTRNSSSIQNFPSTSSVEQLVKTSPGPFFTAQTLTDASILELRDTRNSSSFQNLPSAFSAGQLVQTSPGQIFTGQTLTDTSIPVCVNKKESMVQNFTQNSQEQFADEQSMINDLISEKLDRYMPANTIESGSENATQNDVTSLLDIPCNILDHNYAVPHSFTAGNATGDDQSKACNSTSPYNKFDNTQSSYLNQAQLINFNANSDLNGSFVHHSSSLSEGCLELSPRTEKNKPFSGNSLAIEQHAIANMSPPFSAEFGNFHNSSFMEVPSEVFSCNSDTSILEQSEQYTDMPCNINEDDELILGVLKKEELLEKHSSLTNISTLNKDQRYPSIADFSSIGFEILEEMETSDSESDLLDSKAQNMDCSTEFVPDASSLQNGSMYYQMFGIPNTDCLNN